MKKTMQAIISDIFVTKPWQPPKPQQHHKNNLHRQNLRKLDQVNRRETKFRSVY